MVNRPAPTWLRRGFDALFPPVCLLCQLPSQRQRELCQICEQQLPWLGHCCHRCALPLPPPGPITSNNTQARVCGRCLSAPPAFQRCLSGFRYAFPVDRLVSDFKHHRQLSNGALLAQLWLDQHQQQNDDDRPELLVPVPLHWLRRWRRGFNQAELLSDHWSQVLDIPIANLLHRRRATPAQQGLNRRQRQRNLRQAFTLTDPHRVRNRHIALVDDVLTTGATAHSLAAILARSGARRVDIWCLARTP